MEFVCESFQGLSTLKAHEETFFSSEMNFSGVFGF